MDEFQKIVKLRNAGKTQEEIATELGISRRSVIRYLQTGKIPVYSRAEKATRKNPMANYQLLTEEKIKSSPNILLEDLFESLKAQGYEGSLRTLRRKTQDFRKKIKSKEVYFQRTTIPGEVMEGDFTELDLIIGGKRRRVFVWLVSLPYSNAYFATPFYHCTFECFAEGTVHAFNEFNGIPEKYRLDNLSPVVTTVLAGKDRLTTQRFKELQNHYNFKQDFCNPARGNEKGNVEANNKHFKKQLLSKIAMENLSFTSIDSLREFVWNFCREHNEKEVVRSKLLEENLSQLPRVPFKSFKTEIVKINKFSLFNLGTSGHMYSVPSQYIGLSLEVRVYSSHVEVIDMDKIVGTHKRLHGPKGLVSILPEHIISGLLKKPGAFKDWKYREVLFERQAWRRFYGKQQEKGKEDKDYLKCIKLLLEHDRENLTLAMEMAMENDMDLTSTTLKNLITNDFNNVISIDQMPINLDQYDIFLTGGKNSGSENVSELGVQS